MEVLEDGTRVLRDGTRINPDGSMTLSDGTVIDPVAAQKLAMRRKQTLPPRKPGESEEQYKARVRLILGDAGLHALDIGSALSHDGNDGVG